MKMKKILSSVLALAMTAMLGITAFAEGEPDNGAALDMESVGISKILKVADGVDISNINKFDFSFTGVDGTNTTASEAGNKNVSITVGQPSNGLAVGSLSFADIFGDVSNFEHAGKYVYNVTETTKGFSSSDANSEKELTVDESIYKVSIYVANTEGEGLTYKEVIVEKGDEKVDPTIKEREVPIDPDTTKTATVSGANFVNTYKELVKGNPDSPVLRVEKLITGDYSDKTMNFSVAVVFTIPDTATKEDVEAVSKGTNRVRIAWQGKTGTFTTDLSDKESIVFTKIPAGTTFVVKEVQDENYKSKISGFVISDDIDYVAGDRAVSGKGPIVEKDNKVTIENHSDAPVPTGLVLNNLPYVALVAAAAAGLAILVVKKVARKD